MEELLELAPLAEERRVDLLGRQRRRERQVAARDPLREAQKVGRHLLLLAGEQRPGATEARGDLVDDQVHLVLPTQRGRRRQEAARVHQHPGGALHERLDDERSELAAVRDEDLLQRRERR